jgi:integrase
MATSIRLTEAREQYVRSLRAQGLQERTVKNSQQVIGRGIALWGDILLTSITPGHIDSLFAHYAWKESTRNLYLSNLRAFFKWARTHKWMPKDECPTTGWRTLAVPEVMRTQIPLSEFRELMDAAPHPRDRAVVAMGLFTFMRGGEMSTLRICDLDLDSDELAMRRHKTKKNDVLPVSSELHEEMVRWLNWYRADQGALRPGWYLLPAKHPNHTYYDPTTRQIAVDHTVLASLRPTSMLLRPYTVIQRAMAALGYETYWEGEHTLRRSGARALADTLRDRGFDSALMRVSSMLGHKDTKITQHYIGWDLEKKQRNEDIAGKPMFPSLAETHEVIEFKPRDDDAGEAAHG